MYKNFTVESTRDSEFLDILKRVIPGEALKNWYSIFDAAPAVGWGRLVRGSNLLCPTRKRTQKDEIRNSAND